MEDVLKIGLQAPTRPHLVLINGREQFFSATHDPYAYPRKLVQKMVRTVNTEDDRRLDCGSDAHCRRGCCPGRGRRRSKKANAWDHAVSERFIGAWLRDEKDGALN